MEKPLLDGIYCPSITITKEDGMFDFDAWGAHLEHLMQAGINGVLLFGSIGEFYAYSVEEKIEALSHAISVIDGRMDVLFGIGSTDIEESKALMKAAKEQGATAVVSIPPYYFGPSPKTCVRYYKELAKAADIPIVLYNFPLRTGMDLSPELVRDIVKEVPSVVGIKDTVDCASHTRLMVKVVREVAPAFSVLSGFDEYYMTNRISGGNGILSGLTNVEPELFAKMNAAYVEGDMDSAVASAKRISYLMSIYGISDLFISAIKGGVKCKGLDISTRINEPAQQLSSVEFDQIRELLA